MASDDKPYLTDANIWIAYFDKGETQSELAKEFLEFMIEQYYPIIISSLVIQEVMTVLLYKNKHTLAQDFMEYIQRQPTISILSVDESLLEKITVYMKKHQFRPKLSFTDWSLLFLTEHAKLDLVTLDKQLANTYKRFAKK
ncbi:MAG: PIN domain-containing protein [Candidatus Kerfeldbacteria bacterium]|nr:PIN domain-containing protein [Candidatus Kerfeldbacteria bacterium]